VKLDELFTGKGGPEVRVALADQINGLLPDCRGNLSVTRSSALVGRQTGGTTGLKYRIKSVDLAFAEF
jgi:hypothetical protein